MRRAVPKQCESTVICSRIANLAEMKKLAFGMYPAAKNYEVNIKASQAKAQETHANFYLAQAIYNSQLQYWL